MNNTYDKTLLFSVDLEDVRFGVKNGMNYKERVPFNTYTYLKWLKDRQSKCTFFVEGQTAKLYPSLISEIFYEGHEIACHTTQHKLLSQYLPEEFYSDIQENIITLRKSGVTNITGFRAPSYSLTKETSWAYTILKKLGFTYSSSVLPAKNPLFDGWSEFSNKPVLTDHGIFELPLTVAGIGSFAIPFISGVYLRIVPKFLIGILAQRRTGSGSPLVGFVHPFDIDNEQERFMHGGINNNYIYNWLMYYNRKSVLSKMDCLLNSGYKIMTYKAYVDLILKQRCNGQ